MVIGGCDSTIKSDLKEWSATFSGRLIQGQIIEPAGMQLAQACTEPWDLKLYKVEESQNPTLVETKLTFPTTGSYHLESDSDLEVMGANLYFVEGVKCEVQWRRIVTGGVTQDLSLGGDLLSYALHINSQAPSLLLEVANRSQLQSLFRSVARAPSYDAAYETLTESSAAASFAGIFGDPSKNLRYAPPRLGAISTADSINEGESAVLGLASRHWRKEFALALTWEPSYGVVVHEGGQSLLKIGANSPEKIELKVSARLEDHPNPDGAGRSWRYGSITANDLIANTPLEFSLSGQGEPKATADDQIDVTLITGEGLANCDSFSSLAVTTTAVPPTTDLFSVVCSESPSQKRSLPLAAVDGEQTVYVHSIDARGKLATSKAAKIIRDTTGPVVTLTGSLAKSVKPVTNINFTFDAKDVATEVSSVVAQWLGDNGSQVLEKDLDYPQASYFLSVPAGECNACKLKLVATDRVGNTGSLTSKGIKVDSTPPTAVLTDLPDAIDNQITLATKVDQDDVKSYQFKWGPQGSTDCSTGGYLAPRDSSVLIDSDISGTADDTLRLCVVGKDEAGNWQPQASATSHDWIKDTLAPAVAADTDQSINATATITGTATDLNGVSVTWSQVSGPGTLTFSAETSLSTDVTADTEGAYVIRLTGVDGAGNTTTDDMNLIWDTTPPTAVLTDAPTNPSNLTTLNVTVGGTDVVSYMYKFGLDGSIDCTSAAGYSAETVVATLITDAIGADNTYELCVKGKDTAGNWQSDGDAISVVFLKDVVKPNVTSFAIDTAGPTANNNIQVSMAANDATSSVEQFCLKYNDTSTPLASDGCWKNLSANPPNVTPSTSVSFAGFFYRVGFTVATYNVYVWAKDAADNISDLSAAGAGTNGVDTDSIDYDPGSPPVIDKVIVSNVAVPLGPPQPGSELLIPSGNDVYIKWQASDVEGLAVNPVSLSYSTDDVTYTSIVSNISDGNNGCTADEGGSTLDDGATGCYRWVGGSPTSNYYKIRVTLVDAANLASLATSVPINVPDIELLAGNTERGMGGSAKSAFFKVNMGVDVTDGDNQALVVTNDGTIFVRDTELGIIRVTPETGVPEVFIPMTGTQSGDGGDATLATLEKPNKMALDYSGNLLIYDKDRIRLVDLSLPTPTIDTFIGGGALTTDNIDPLDLLMAGPSQAIDDSNHGNGRQMIFTPMPNGDLWFQSDNFSSTPTNGWGLRVYTAATGKVMFKTIGPGGDGHLTEPGLASLLDCRMQTFGFEFNPSTSALTSAMVLLNNGNNTPQCEPDAINGTVKSTVNLNPTTFVSTAPHPPSPITWTQGSRLYMGMDGALYSLSRETGQILKWNDGTNSWDAVIGSGPVAGHCADGTAALSCQIYPTSLFVSATGLIYFMDGSLVRTIDDSGNVLTIMGTSGFDMDGTYALAARIGKVTSFDYRTDINEFIYFDIDVNMMGEFSKGGTISKIAGNGSLAIPNSSAAINQPLALTTYNTPTKIVANPSTGDVYASINGHVRMLNRGTGIWDIIGGQGGTNFDGADGLDASSIDYIAPLHIHGFDGADLMISSGQGDPQTSAKMKTIRIADNIQRGFLGDGSLGQFCEGMDADSCSTPNWRSDYFYGHASPDLPRSRWLLGHNQTSAIYSVGLSWNGDINEGAVSKLTNTATNAIAMDYRRDGADDVIYYCSNADKRLYKHTVGSGDVALNWPIPTMKCVTQTLKYDPVADSLYFIYEQNGLYGLAEYTSP